MSNAENIEFWDELCGSTLAATLGVKDASPDSLAKFDRWFGDFYPYLDRHIPFQELKGKRVLEVGLGYGTVAQRLAEAGAQYHGLDIAAGPVAMARLRLRQAGLAGEVRQGSILDCPWPDGHFDHVVAIGCYHHTGDIGRAIAETRRVLRPGGGATIMVYNAYSYRRWRHWTGATLRALLAERSGRTPPPTSAAERAHYDTDTKGRAAPETVFVSERFLRRAMADWSALDIVRENFDFQGGLARFVPRSAQLRWLAPWCGLDLYCRAVK